MPLAYMKPYVSPDVCVRRLWIVMGSTCATVAGLVAGPFEYTRVSPKDGMCLATGSVSSSLPSSNRIIAATDVIGFVIE